MVQVHVMAECENGPAEWPDGANCGDELSDEAEVVYHPDAQHVGGEEWLCPDCGLDTRRDPGTYVTRLLN